MGNVKIMVSCQATEGQCLTYSGLATRERSSPRQPI